MEQWLEIRRRVLREGVSKRQIMRETGMHWETLKKILEHPSPPGYQRSKSPNKPKIGPYLGRIQQILEEDKCVRKNQRHTAKKIWELLQEDGFTGGYTIVKDVVRELKRSMKEVYVPLKHPPGEAQVDFGHAVVKMSGVLRKICFFVMTQPSIKQKLVQELMVGEYIDRKENVLLVGNSGTGKTHLASALGFAGCMQGRKVRFFTVKALANELIEMTEQRQLERALKRLERQDVLILDELGYVPFSRTASELLFEVISRAYERLSLIVTTNMPLNHGWRSSAVSD